MNIEILYQIILMLAGIGTIMYGIKVMNGGVENALGFKFKKILAKQNKRYFKNYLFGTGMSFVVQTSTVTNIMATGLINIGTLNLSQGIAICLGSGLGSALAVILLIFESVSVIKILSLFVFVGAIMFVFTKTSRGQLLSKIFLGFGLLCFGITILSMSVANIVGMVDLTSFFGAITNPILFLLICLVLTMVMQSGYPVVVILVSIVSLGLIDFETACYGILGMNIGSALVVSLLLSLFDDGNNGKRLIVFNILHKIVFSVLIGLLMLIPGWLGFLHTNLCGGVASISLVVFNIILCFVPIILLPVCSQFAKMMKFILKGKKNVKKDDYASFEIDEKTLGNAVVAYSKIRVNIKRIYDLVFEVKKNMFEGLFKEEKYLSQRGKLKAIEKAIKLTNNNLIVLAGKVTMKGAQKINTTIDVVENMQRLLKSCGNINEMAENKAFLKGMNKAHISYASIYYSQILDFGERLKIVLDEENSKSQKDDELKILFKTNDIMVLNRNKAKKKLIKNNGFDEGSINYFDLLYELENIQQDCFDMAIKIVLLED